MVSLRWLTLFQGFWEVKGLTGGKYVLLIFTPPSTLSAKALCGSLWGLGSSLRSVLFLLFTLPLVACSLANCIVIILQTIILHLLIFVVHHLQWWIVRYGFITPSIDLVLREFP